jgi:hypothetical protein
MEDKEEKKIMMGRIGNMIRAKYYIFGPLNLH